MIAAVCLGDNCIDRYLPPVGRAFVGGNALNAAVYLQRSGVPTAYIGAVGADPAGEQVIDRLRREGVDASRVKVLPGCTAVSEIALNAGGDREFVFEDPGPIRQLRLEDEDLMLIRGSRLVHTTWMGGERNFLGELRPAGDFQISLDYGERSSPEYIEATLGQVDLAFFSMPEDQAGQAAGFARRMQAGGPRLVVVTLGRFGSVACDGRLYEQPAAPVEAVDTLGAGDAYIGTFLGGYLRGKPVESCMQAAARVAAAACTHYGGWTQSPLPHVFSARKSKEG